MEITRAMHYEAGLKAIIDLCLHADSMGIDKRADAICQAIIDFCKFLLTADTPTMDDLK